MPPDKLHAEMDTAPTLQSLAAMIARRATAAPDASAIETAGAMPLNNRALQALSTSVHQAINAAGLDSFSRIALTAPDGPEFAAAATTIAAHAVCVPLNPNLGPDAWYDMLKNLRVDALVAPESCTEARAATLALGLPVLDLGPVPESGAGAFTLHCTDPKIRPGTKRSADPGLDDVTFVLPTSGTTGKPKAVPLTHRNIAHAARNTGAALDLTKYDRLIGVLPLHHAHGLISGLMATLYAGASVIVLRGFSTQAFFDHLKRFRPTWLTAVPAIHQAILDAAPGNAPALEKHSLRLIRSASAPMPGPQFDALARLFGIPVIETYGMTEAASQIASTPVALWRERPGAVGKAAGPEIAILDDKDQPQPPDVVGQITLRGPNMTLGYDDPVATASAFTRDGWFRTGDLGRLDADGFLFIVGRLKEVINRGGAKIFPGRIETVLTQHSSVVEAAAFAVPHRRLGEEVAAAVVAADGCEIIEADLRRFALNSGELADTEVPRRILTVKSLPKTLTGKIRRAELAEGLGLTRPKDDQAVSAHESEVIAIWQDVMGINIIGATDDFFHLGGDSLMAVETALRLAEQFDVSLTLRDFFEAPTPRAMANRLRNAEPDLRHFQIIKSPPGVMQKPVSMSQERMLLLESAWAGLPTNTVPLVYFVQGPFSPKIFETSLRGLIARHEIFRTIYRKVAGKWVGIPTATVNLRLEAEDWRWASTLDNDGFILDALENEVWDILDPTKSAPFRIRVLQLGNERHALMLMYHHIAMDNWTIRAFVAEIFEHYRDIQAKRPLSRPPPRFQFAEFASWQESWTTGSVAAAQRHYWMEKLKGLRPVLPAKRTKSIGFGTGRTNVALPKDVVDALTTRAASAGATLFMGVIAALKVFLRATFRRNDVTIVVPTANRSRPATGDLLGPIANNAAIRTNVAGKGFDAALAAVRDAVLEADAHQELPFEMVMDNLAREDAVAADSLSDIYLSLVDTFEPTLDDLGLTLHRMTEDQAFETPMPFGSSKLMFLLKLVDGAILGTCIFKPHYFDDAEMDDLMDAFSDAVPHMIASNSVAAVD